MSFYARNRLSYEGDKKLTEIRFFSFFCIKERHVAQYLFILNGKQLSLLLAFSATLLTWTLMLISAVKKPGWKNTQKNSPRLGFKSLDLVSERTYRDS